MSKLLITGGTGFWGKNVLELLINNDKLINNFSKIVVLTRDSKKFLTAYPHFRHINILYINGDIRNFSIEDKDFSYIMHLATDASKELNDHNPLEMLDVIINGTRNLLALAQQQTQIKKILFASSGAVYGRIPETVNFVKETQQFDLDFSDPINTYAQSKRTAELMCQAFMKIFNIPIVIVRGFSFNGKYLPETNHLAYGNFIRQAKEEGKIIIQGDGTPKRSYMDVGLLANILITIMLQPNLQYNVYNIGSDNAKTLYEWAQEISKKYNNIPIEILGHVQVGYSAGNNYIPDITRLKNERLF